MVSVSSSVVCTGHESCPVHTTLELTETMSKCISDACQQSPAESSEDRDTLVLLLEFVQFPRRPGEFEARV